MTEDLTPSPFPGPSRFERAAIPDSFIIQSGERTTRKPCPRGHDPASNRSRSLIGSLSMLG